MAQGGEIFLLDMGEPVRIRELAMTMIQLSGLAVAGDDGSDGDIEIVDIGLRPGEKIHEELLIDRQGLPTSHPRIVKASERFASSLTFERLLTQLLSSIDERDCEASLAIVENLIAPALRNVPDPEGKPSVGNRRRNANVAKGESPLRTRGMMIRKRAVES